MRFIQAILPFALMCVVNCGGDDGPGASAAGGTAGSASSGKSGSDAGGTSGAGAPHEGDGGDPTATGATSSGGTSAAGATATGEAGADDPGVGGQPAAGDCALEPAVVSCEVDSGGGVRVCNETAIEGTPADVTRDQCGGTVREGEHCPSAPNLVGYCKGGITTYYYAPPDNNVWATLGQSCPALMGIWCPG